MLAGGIAYKLSKRYRISIKTEACIKKLNGHQAEASRMSDECKLNPDPTNEYTISRQRNIGKRWTSGNQIVDGDLEISRSPITEELSN